MEKKISSFLAWLSSNDDFFKSFCVVKKRDGFHITLRVIWDIVFSTDISPLLLAAKRELGDFDVLLFDIEQYQESNVQVSVKIKLLLKVD